MERIFIGYDSREPVAYDVAKFSIKENTKGKYPIIPLNQAHMRELGIYTRPVDQLASTEFTFSRFWAPYLSDYKGWAIFCDCDFLFMCDVKEIFDYADSSYAVQVCKHDYTPKDTVKMDGQTQHIYPRKNWSSMILFNCSHPANRLLNLSRLNNTELTGQYFHRFSWLKDDEIGEIPIAYNWLAETYNVEDHGKPKVVHFTSGGPWFSQYFNCDYHQEWKDAYERMTGETFTDSHTVI